MNVSTATRLANYYDFSPEVIDEVAEFAERQKQYATYGEFFAATGVPDVQRFIPSYGTPPIEVIDVRPIDHDPKKALIYHLPMANPLDNNQLYQIATIAATNPDTRVIAVGNPSGGRRWDSGRLNKPERQLITYAAAGGLYLDPLVQPTNEYISRQGIEVTQEVGLSYGGLKAALSAAYTKKKMRDVSDLVVIEPVVGPRNLRRLGMDFRSTDKALSGYVNASDLPTFNEARKDSISALKYTLGLARLSNIAIAKALTKGTTLDFVGHALIEHQEMNATIIWGDESELAVSALTQQLVRGLQDQGSRPNKPQRVHSLIMPGQKHAFPNDVHLQAAVVRQAFHWAV